MKLDLEEQMGAGAAQSHILVFPFPVQGHMNPMVQFAKRLVSKGQRVTIVTTFSASKSVQTLNPTSFGSNLKMEFISDGSKQVKDSETIEESIERFRISITKSLTNLMMKIRNSSDASQYPLKFVVYHSGMPWVLDVARRQGIDGAPFFTTSGAVATIFHHVHEGTLQLPLEGPRAIMPSMPPLELNDLPTFLSDVESYPAFLKLAMNQYSNLKQVNCIFYSSFDKLEKEVLKWMESQDWPVKMIGPTIPSVFLDKRLEDDKDYGLSLFKPNVETCMQWLDSKKPGSVVYASFGSLANLSIEQTAELAWGLKNSSFNFLWVVRETEKDKLPKNFVEEISGKGLVVSWCPQLQVLAHKAVGCFLTHCGWNSTLEALSLGVPMVVLPHWADQPTNAKFVEDVWKVGVRVNVNKKSGLATKEEIAVRIKEVMNKEKGMKFKKASLIWKELAKEAVDEGGSSDKNIEEFVAKVLLI
ncbi:putative UDP-glucuronosyl/UDP-glucosyltransferase [Rosa chinensis]|uniref:Glycosyltransferase n=1 Tax=Rosa chinensis TaxID=74649 RepID=A0A2P6QV49_ROSCH|nr:mogroside IE synthase [Rosa chinensis]PRQ38056.1 putative UDP-glucuronosyl/UDP-glucosyltransferase [Rosa chinensis]